MLPVTELGIVGIVIAIGLSIAYLFHEPTAQRYDDIPTSNLTVQERVEVLRMIQEYRKDSDVKR